MRRLLVVAVLLCAPATATADEPDIDFTTDMDEGPVEVIVTQDPTPLEHESLLPDRFEHKWQQEVWTLLDALRRARIRHATRDDAR